MKNVARILLPVLVLAVGLALVGCQDPNSASDSYSGSTGTVEGTVRDATDFSAVEGAEVTVDDHSEFSTETDSDGMFSLECPTGSQTLVITAPGYVFPPVTVEVTEDTTSTVWDGDTVGSPTVATDGLRLVLSWGDTPEDLDAHLLTPNGQHVYFGSREPAGAGANLDRDDVSSYGPETITITEPQSGTYVYYVYNFDEYITPYIRTSDAVVQVYDEDGLVDTFSVPTSGDGEYWHVLNLTSDGSGSFSVVSVNDIVSTAPTNS